MRWAPLLFERERGEEGEIEPVVAREIRVEGDIEQAEVSLGIGRGHAPDRLGIERGLGGGRLVHDPEVAAALRDQQVAVGQERDRERPGQRLGHDRDLDAMLLGSVEHIRRRRQRRRRDAVLRRVLRGGRTREQGDAKADEFVHAGPPPLHGPV